MSTRVNLGNGKYCYSGPNCKWHSATGTINAKKAITIAQQKVALSMNFDDMTEASDELRYAMEAYNSTPEGLAALELKLALTTDPLEEASLQIRFDKAQALADEVNAKEQEAWDKANVQPSSDNPFQLAENHTYEEALYHEENPGMYSAVVGSKYESGKYLSSAELTKSIRNDLKEAQSKGYLPKALKFSVTKEDFSGGRSVSISIRGMDNKSIYGKDIQTKAELNQHFQDSNSVSDSQSKNTNEIMERVKGIADAYNNQSIHSEIDYFSTSYYSRVKIEDKFDREWREDQSTRKKAMVSAKGVEKIVSSSLKSNNQEIEKTFTPMLKTSDDVLVSRRGRVIMLDTPEGKEFYNMSSLYAAGEQEWMNSIAQASSKKIRSMRRNRIH